MERPILITSNCTIKDIEIQLGERIVSRLFELTQGISVPGADFRKRKLGWGVREELGSVEDLKNNAKNIRIQDSIYEVTLNGTDLYLT